MQVLTGLAQSVACAGSASAIHARAQIEAKAAIRGRIGAGPYTNAGGAVW
jgi:hypothetical protein